MKVLVTGATGHLGGLVLKHLSKMLPVSELAAGVRDIKKAAHFSEAGIEIRRADYDDAGSLTDSFKGVDRLLFISASDIDNSLRIIQHANVVKAARDAGVGYIAYTGFAFAEDSKLSLSYVHSATEYAILASGIPYTFLRHGFYTEVFVNEGLKFAVESGVLSGNAGKGRLNSVAREDLARAAATVMAGSGHENRSYNLVADTLWDFAQLAEVVSRIAGKKVEYRPVTFEEYRAQLMGAGLPEQVADMLAGIYRMAAEGELERTSDDLMKLTGRKTPLEDTVKQALKG